MPRQLQRFLRCDSGATAIEYGLIAAGIALVVVAAVNGIGVNLKATFKTVKKALK